MYYKIFRFTSSLQATKFQKSHNCLTALQQLLHVHHNGRTISARISYAQFHDSNSNSNNNNNSHNSNNNSSNNDWRRQQMEYNERRRKIIPQLIYLHNPWKFLLTKLNLWRLRIFWDREFVEEEFIRGSKQAAIVLTNIIRTQNASKISEFTTPIGFQQITRDMLLSRNDTRLKLIKFETEHLRRAIPMKVVKRTNRGRRYCFIDMLFVGLRNTKDFESVEELVEIKQVLHKLDTDMKTPMNVIDVAHRIVFAEIFIRFRRNYSILETDQQRINDGNERDWSVSFYKILSFDVLNYDPAN